METNQKVCDDVVQADFERFLDAMDLRDKVEAKLSKDDAAELDELKETVFRAMRRGTLSVNDKGEMVFMPQVNWTHGPLTFREPTGAELMNMDKVKAGQNVARQNALMGGITNMAATHFSKMAMRDYRVCQAITTLFLA